MNVAISSLIKMGPWSRKGKTLNSLIKSANFSATLSVQILTLHARGED
jgi:hypothetical protein